MKIDETIVKKLAYYVALNGCSVNSSGLYNGKAGMALSLFEIADFFKDEYLEEQAFLLLQEALLTRTQDIDFENGLSGIGYALFYLINNHLIEADIEELLNDKIQTIIGRTEYLIENHANTEDTSNIKVIYFLYHYYLYTSNEKILRIMHALLDRHVQQLKLNLREIEKKEYKCSKIEVSTKIKEYINLVIYCKMLPVSAPLLEYYMLQCQKGYWTSCFFVSYGIIKVAKRALNTTLLTAAEQLLELSICNIKPERMLLAEQIDFSFRLTNSESYCTCSKNISNFLFITDENELSLRLTHSIPTCYLKAGYQSGVSRWLLLAANEMTERKRNDILFPL